MENKKERGSLIVEATIVFPTMFLIIFLMIFAGNAYLQKCRVEAIVTQQAIEGAAHCADPQLTYASNGKMPSLNELHVYPYRFFDSNGVGDLEGTVKQQIYDKVSQLSSGLFSGMKPNLQKNDIYVDYSSGFLYATLTVEAKYKIELPIRLLGQKQNMNMRVNTRVQMPVSDSVELVRNIDMIWDYMERFGLAQKFDNAKAKLEESLDKVNDWFGGGK